MTYAVWPASLTQGPLLLDGSDETLAKNTIRSQMDAGPDKVRVRSSALGSTHNAVVRLKSKAERLTLVEFYRQTLAYGSLPFQWTIGAEESLSGLTGFGSCLVFSGGGYVRIPNVAGYTAINAGFTVEFMLKVDDLDDPQGVIAKSSAGKRTFTVFKEAGSTSPLTFRAHDVLGGSADLYSDEYLIPDTDWHRWSWTCDAAAGSKIYLDGVLVASAAILGGSGDNEIEYSTAPITIGRAEDNSGTIYFATGRIDDVRIWNDNQLAADILDLWDEELVGNESGLIGYWKFNEAFGVTAEDSTVLANDGFVRGPSYLPRTMLLRFAAEPVITPETHTIFRAALRLEELTQ